MDKRNYSVNEAEKQELMRISEKVRKEIIRELEKTQIFQRKRKLTSYAALFEALYKYLVEGLSFYQLASYMSCKRNIKLCVTAWKKQFYKAIPVFRTVVEAYMAKHIMPERKSECKTAGKREIFALDATAFSAQGHHGTATRVHAQISLSDGLCRYDKITDEHIAESVKNFPLKQGALYLADRAYAKAQQIAWVIDHKADLLFRFSPQLIKLYKDPACTKRLNVDTLLTRDVFSYSCYMRYKNKAYPIRIIGMQLSEEYQAAAQKKYVEKPLRIRCPFRTEHSSMRNGFFCSRRFAVLLQRSFWNCTGNAGKSNCTLNAPNLC